MHLGKLKQSEELSRRAVELFTQQNRHENAANVLLSLAGNMVVLGKCEPAKKYVKDAMTLFEGEFGIANAATIHAACGDRSRAESMMDALRAAAPKNTFVVSIITPMVRAEIEKNRGNTAEAIQLLESIRAYDLGDTIGLANNYSRGNLYLQQRRANEAAAEFKKIVDNFGVNAMSPFHPLARLGLATPPRPASRTRISLLSGKTPIPTCPTWFKPARNMSN
jgi:predicted Zn-dependent protease